MATRHSSSEKTSIQSQLVLWLTGAVILGMYVAFGRLVAGSWRQLAALALAVATYLAGMVVLERLVRPRTAEKWRRVSPVFPFVGALAGGVYVLVSTASGIGPAITGIVWGVVHLWLVWRQARNVAAGATAAEARPR